MKSVWNKPPKTPDVFKEKPIVVIYEAGNQIEQMMSNEYFCRAGERYVSRWCYLQDLIDVADSSETKGFYDGLFKWLCEAWDEIKSGLFESDGYEIVDKPKGTKTEIDIEESNFDAIPKEYSFLTHQYVNQTTNGGYTGDEFSGDLYFPLPDGKYMKVYYNCY